jgi:PAS domain S-box-containing protein
MHSRVLIVDDEEGIRYTFSRFLAGKGYEVETAGDYGSAMDLIGGGEFEVILADIHLGGMTGLDLLREVRALNLTTPVVLFTGVPELGSAQEAVRLGAYDYVAKPIGKDALVRIVGKATEFKRLRDENVKAHANLDAVFRSVGELIVTVDAGGRVLSYNEMARRICGLGPGAVGGEIGAALAGCDGGCVDSLLKTVRTGETVEVYRRECRREGREPLVLNLTASPLLDPQGRAYGAVLSGRDVTRLVRLEDNQRGRVGVGDMLGVSPAMQSVFSLIDDLSGVTTTVLVTGESGTGKELVAEALHRLGPRHAKPLVKVNCAGLAESLLESELFGHVRGAFSGAVSAKVGRFELASGGTIFLDEIGDISPAMQSRLLRVLQFREFERVGDSHTLKVDVRVVAATNKDLPRKVRAGEFREDLYYRLKVVELRLPPLRERGEDIPLLLMHYVRVFNAQFGRGVAGVTDEVLRLASEYPWPGNVRELAHMVEHAFVHCRGEYITLEDMPPEFRAALPASARKASAREGEKERILEALRRSAGNKARAARTLGMSRQTLYRKLREHDIPETPGEV